MKSRAATTAPLLPRGLTEDELAAALVLASVDALVDDDLTADEYNAFLATLAM